MKECVWAEKSNIDKEMLEWLYGDIDEIIDMVGDAE